MVMVLLMKGRNVIVALTKSMAIRCYATLILVVMVPHAWSPSTENAGEGVA